MSTHSIYTNLENIATAKFNPTCPCVQAVLGQWPRGDDLVGAEARAAGAGGAGGGLEAGAAAGQQDEGELPGHHHHHCPPVSDTLSVCISFSSQTDSGHIHCTILFDIPFEISFSKMTTPQIAFFHTFSVLNRVKHKTFHVSIDCNVPRRGWWCGWVWRCTGCPR